MPTRTDISRWLATLAVIGLIGGCATTGPGEPQAGLPGPVPEKVRVGSGTPPQLPGRKWPPASPGNPPFYDVMGKRYFVLPDSEGFHEQGVASWYGREFHGRRTSSGEPYDMYALTAAHRTLPLPTTARVTNLETGKSIIVRINDRGPFKKDRVMDLSYAAARELGILNAGTGLVEVQAIDDTADNTAAAAPGSANATRSIYLQVGAFSEQRNAQNLQLRLQQQGIANAIIHHDGSSARGLYRVRIGPVMNAEEFDKLAQRVEVLNLGPSQLVVESSDRTDGSGASAATPGG